MFQCYPRVRTEDKAGKRFKIKLSKTGKKDLDTRFPINPTGFGAGLTDKLRDWRRLITVTTVYCIDWRG